MNDRRRPPSLIASVQAALVVLLAGCLTVNPGFDEPTESEGPATTSTSAPTTSTTGTTAAPTTSTVSGTETDTGPGTTEPVLTTDPGSTAGPTTGTSGTQGTNSGSTGSTGSTGDTSSSTGSTGDTSSSTGEELLEIELPADQAGCIVLPMDPLMLVGPIECEQTASLGNTNGGIGDIVVDSMEDNYEGRPTRVLLRFPGAPELDGATIVSVELALSVTDFVGAADSVSTGTIYQSEIFDLGVIMQNAPDVIGNEIGADQGPAGIGETFAWDLPVNVLGADQPTYLQVVPVSPDGVHYWSLNGPDPSEFPRLRVLYTP